MPTSEAQVRAHLEPEEPDYKAAAAALGPDALPILERLIQTADPLLASKAAYLASMIPGEQAAHVLEQAARSRHPTVRVAAAAGMHKHPEVSDAVAGALIGDPDPGVRKVAAKASRTRGRSGPRDESAGAAAPAAESAAGEEDDHGGGGPPDTNAAAESAAGEGGGDLGEALRSAPTADTADAEEDSGGGGDLTAGIEVRTGRSADGPDGGGLLGTASVDEGGASAHGGGQV